MKELYQNLLDLVASSDDSKFFFKDYITGAGTHLRIFSYHYASYSDWIRPDALECRGITFELDDDQEPVRIVARPMEKFFNLNETPITMNLDLTTIKYAATKADGSLVSSCIVDGHLNMKSKTSFISEQSASALSLIYSLKYEHFKEKIEAITRDGYTCNLEYVAPTNRIVLDYQEPALILLNVRNNETGEYISQEQLYAIGELRPFLAEVFEVSEPDAWVKNVRELVGIEGYVCELESGQRFKLKTDWYCALHHTKDSITNNKDLFECIVQGASDDLHGMFSTDDWAIKKIQTFEQIHRVFMSEALQLTQEAHEKFRHQERKSFVQSVQNFLPKGVMQNMFGPLMGFYGRELEVDELLDKINVVFMKNVDRFVPDEYKKEVIILEE